MLEDWITYVLLILFFILFFYILNLNKYYIRNKIEIYKKWINNKKV